MSIDVFDEQPQSEQPEELHAQFTDAQQIIIAIVPRIAGCISLVSAAYMAYAAFQQRSRIYHRLMLGLTIHLILQSFWTTYGAAAVPVGTPNVWGAAGNTQTCTAQGFFVHVSMTAFFYYGLLALYSFQAVRNNFKEKQYLWIEKWIHLAVHIFPVGSAFYLVAIEAFNFTGNYACYIASIPYGCGGEEGGICERGPQNIVATITIFGGLPYAVILTFPAIVMIALYVDVRRRQKSIRIQAKAVAKQGGLYLLALYWTFLFAYISTGLQKYSNIQIFVIALLRIVNVNLYGFWMLLIYLYFRVSPSVPSSAKTTAAGESFIESIRGDESGRASGGVSRRENHSTREEEEQNRFSIFDGTNAGGAFSQFIFDADSDDEEEDQRETLRWDHDVQRFV